MDAAGARFAAESAQGRAARCPGGHLRALAGIYAAHSATERRAIPGPGREYRWGGLPPSSSTPLTVSYWRSARPMFLPVSSALGRNLARVNPTPHASRDRLTASGPPPHGARIATPSRGRRAKTACSDSRSKPAGRWKCVRFQRLTLPNGPGILRLRPPDDPVRGAEARGNIRARDRARDGDGRTTGGAGPAIQGGGRVHDPWLRE